MAKVSFPITQFTDSSGNPLVSGYITVRLNTDGMASASQLSAIACTIQLDNTGHIVGSPTFWPNAQIQPSGTYYIVRAFAQDGQLVSGPNSVTI